MINNRIGGTWVPPASGSYLRLDPSPPTTGAPVRVARSGGQDLHLALDAARAAAGPWGLAGPSDRLRLLRRLPWRLRERCLEGALDNLARRVALEPSDRHPQAALLRLWLGAVCGALAGRDGPRIRFEGARAGGVATLALAAEAQPGAGMARLVRLLVGGSAVVCAVLYARPRPADAWTSALFCALSACLPAGVLNVVHGLGMEVGIPLVSGLVSRQPADPASGQGAAPGATASLWAGGWR